MPGDFIPAGPYVPEGGGGGGGGTTDHRNLTHRNDANQHTGDAVKVTTTWPGDSEPSDKTLTEGTAAIIAAMASILEVQVFT